MSSIKIQSGQIYVYKSETKLGNYNSTVSKKLVLYKYVYIMPKEFPTKKRALRKILYRSEYPDNTEVFVSLYCERVIGIVLLGAIRV